MNALRLALGLSVLLAITPVANTYAGAVIREAGAVYLEDLVSKPVKLTTLDAAPIFYQSDMGRYLGTLKKGQQVEIQAVADHAYRVRGLAQQGQVAGWVDPKFLAPLKKEFIENLKQNAARREEVAALIAKKEIAVNMTADEVVLALGKPSKKTSRVDANGREEVWEFIRYERVPQDVTNYDRYGRLVTSVVYVKVPAGKLSVVFSNDLVSSLEQSEGSLERDARVRIVAAPFAVAF